MLERERGRQAQLPKRYEIQKNIPRRTSSSTWINKLNNFNEDVNLNNRLISGYNGSPLLRHDSQGRLKNLPITAPLNLAQFKRHSIANISSSNHKSQNSSVVNAYNDSNVFETTVPGRRNYVFEQFHQQQIQQKNTVLNRNRFTSVDTTNIRSKSTDYSDTPSQSQNQKLFESSYFQDSRAINNSQSGSVFSKAINKIPNPNDSRLSSTISVSSQGDATVSQCQSIEASDEDSDEDNSLDETATSITDDNIIAVSLELNESTDKSPSTKSDNNESTYEYENLSNMMRTQWKQLMIKNEIDGDLNNSESENESVGSAWLNQDNYTSTLNSKFNQSLRNHDGNHRRTDDSGKTNQTKPLHRQPGVWTQNSLYRRNMHENVACNLRNLVLFSRNPVVSSLKRTVHVHPSIDIHEPTRPHIAGSNAAGARVKRLWDDACAEFYL